METLTLNKNPMEGLAIVSTMIMLIALAFLLYIKYEERQAEKQNKN